MLQNFDLNNYFLSIPHHLTEQKNLRLQLLRKNCPQDKSEQYQGIIFHDYPFRNFLIYKA